MIIKPLKEILFFEKGTENPLFKVDCLDGRAKWKETTKILSLKSQVSEKVEETKELNELQQNSLSFDLEILGCESFETLVKKRFCDFTVTKLELRSFTITFNKDEDSYWRYFVEGSAKELKTII